MDMINALHVGKRLLLTDRFTYIPRTEVEVVELSPSGQNVKLKNPVVGTTYWTPVEDHRIVEELPRQLPPEIATVAKSDPDFGAVNFDARGHTTSP